MSAEQEAWEAAIDAALMEIRLIPSYGMQADELWFEPEITKSYVLDAVQKLRTKGPDSINETGKS